MSLKLRHLDDDVFEAKNGDTFQVKLSVNRGAVQVLSARYGSQQTTENPANLSVEVGKEDLIVVFQATNNDALVRLHEIDGSESQFLTDTPAFNASLSVEVRQMADGRETMPQTRRASRKRAARTETKRAGQ